MQNGRREYKDNSEKDSATMGGGSVHMPMAWEDVGKIYLPDPPPALAVDKIEDPAAYIEENFETNGAVWRFRPGSHASKRSLIRSAVVCLLFAVIAILTIGALASLVWGFIAGATVTAVFCAVVFWLRKRKLYSAQVGAFRLVRPVAVKKGCGEKGDAAYERYLRRHHIGAEEGRWALAVYYEYEGEPREAETEEIYTREQLDRLVGAFLKGKLVVACRKSNFWGDRAVVCSPELLSVSGRDGK